MDVLNKDQVKAPFEEVDRGMSSIEKIRAYIRRTGIKYDFSTPYQMSLSETLELARMSKEDASGAICLAFEYGRAKGERSARAALKKLR